MKDIKIPPPQSGTCPECGMPGIVGDDCKNPAHQQDALRRYIDEQRETMRLLVAGSKTLQVRVAALEEALRAAKRPHDGQDGCEANRVEHVDEMCPDYGLEDPKCACPRAACTCPADAHNARIDRALAGQSGTLRALIEQAIRVGMDARATFEVTHGRSLAGDFTIEGTIPDVGAIADSVLGAPSAEADSLAVARAALAMMMNDHGHTSLCWRDRQTHGVAGCMSEVCSLARRALGIAGLRDDEMVVVRERLAAACERTL